MYPYVQGQPDYTRSGAGFIPEVWSSKALEKFYLSTVFGDVANTDYEGEIKAYGDKVHIRTIPDIEINDYVAGQTLNVQRPTSGKVELNIDRGHYFNFIVDDVLRNQFDQAWMERWSNDAGMQMKIKVDGVILNAVYLDAGTYNKGATAGVKSQNINLGTAGAPIQLTKANVLDFLVDAGTVLDEQNRPDTDRKLVLPAWVCGLIKKSDLKDASITGDGVSVLRNGRIGMIDRWEIFMSNNLNVVVDGSFRATHALGLHKSAVTFAAQFVEMDTLKSESTFGQLVRGLNVYGYETVQPDSLLDMYIAKG